MTFWPSTLPPDPLFDAIAERVLAAAAERMNKEWSDMSEKPSGVAASYAAACDIGRGMDEDERIARQFHATYERLSAEYGYHTRLDTREFDPESPNGRLMIATVREIMLGLRLTPAEREAVLFAVTVHRDNPRLQEALRGLLARCAR